LFDKGEGGQRSEPESLGRSTFGVGKREELIRVGPKERFHSVDWASRKPRDAHVRSPVVMEHTLDRVEQPGTLMGVWVDHTDQHRERREPIREWPSVTIDRVEFWISVECCHGRNGSGCANATHPCIVCFVHPMERLRYVARAGSAPDRILVGEAVPALGAFSSQPGAMLVALRQLISRQPESPGLLALAAHMLQALDPLEAGWAFADALDTDRTSEQAEEVAISESGGTDVIDSIITGPGEALCPLGTGVWVDHASAAGRSVVLVTPMGTRLPRLLYGSYLERNGCSSSDDVVERIPLSRFDDLIGPDGVLPVSSWVPDCPDVAEVARL